MNRFQNLYLVRVFRQNKILFAFILLFIGFQIYFNNKRIHSFPFFVWDMYSRPATLPDTLTQTEVFVDGKRLDVTKLPIWEELSILHTYKMYNWQRINDYNDPMDEVVRLRTKYFPERIYSFAAWKINNHASEAATYPAWLKQYLEKTLDRKIKSVELRDVQYKYENGHFRAIHNSWTVLKVEP
ncbi:MAG: hypothetical protein U0X41_02905 [Chitinophagales bacterium]